ncbi:glycyl-radical enzyme activating protein [Desulfosudis oleivorans]|uniref:Glycyl-radical enzyme activating protein family n=1 Tax=Desulfosudis oleivorans (strain DSM 6200 / JCM 39069 / Hxd3) TaxID=96561 RepID=A8ZUG4_DESOH|nr:glycyl-radical enzyme activating protein [Desulfosudis oleivorans]ABW67996.1 glycyl-radical enzyme activating protein family [Desulfosudis oleivorans Hxd3]
MTNTQTPLVLDIKGNSLDDGPGIRSVIFFKGCPLSCVWCHNPESKKAGPEIAFDKGRCIDCGACRETCPEQALSKANPFYIDRKRCTLCFACVAACPSGALEQVGKEMPVTDILEQVLPDKPFFDASGGGVTLSGGEPTLFMDFTADLLTAIKREDIHTLVETCGLFDAERFVTMLYPMLDTIYFDIKIIDPTAHKTYCGVPNDRILANFATLFARAPKDGKTLLPRTPLIPGITDTEKNITDIAAFLKKLGVTQSALLAYNPLWHDKTDKIGTPDPYKTDKAMTAFADNSVLEKSRKIFAEAGIET